MGSEMCIRDRNTCIDFRQAEESHIMENIIYNELKIRGYNVDVGEVNVTAKTSAEVDFVANIGNKRYYIQSALDLPTPQKMMQEEKSLLNIRDGFKKIIIKKESLKRFTNEKQKHKGYDCQRKSFRVYGAFCICSARNYIFYVSFAQKHIKSSPPENKDNLHCQYGGCGKRVLFKIVNIFFAVGDNFIFHFFFFLLSVTFCKICSCFVLF